MHWAKRWIWAVSLGLLAAAGCTAQPTGDAAAGPSIDERLAEARAATNPEARAQAFAEVAVLQQKANDLSGAAESFGSARAACGEITDPAVQAQALAHLADAQAQAGNRADARRVLDAARQSADKVGQAEARAKALVPIAVAHARRLQDAAGADEQFQAAGALVAQVSDPEGKVAAQMEIARGRALLDQKPAAAAALSAALAAAKDLSDPFKACQNLSQVASLEHQLGLASAAQTFERALEQARRVPSEYSRAHALVDVAQRLAESGQSAKAREVLSAALSVAKSVPQEDTRREAVDKVEKAMRFLPSA